MRQVDYVSDLHSNKVGKSTFNESSLIKCTPNRFNGNS